MINRARIRCFFLLVIMLQTGAQSAIAQARVRHGFKLQHWCEKHSKQYYLSKGITPYNWSASYLTLGDALVVRGQWKVNGKAESVNCRVLKGAPKRFAVLVIPSESFLKPRKDSEHLINSKRQLRKWCKFKSAQYFLQQEETTLYNWVILPTVKSERLTVTGQWSVNNAGHTVHCSIRKGLAEKYAVMKVD